MASCWRAGTLHALAASVVAALETASNGASVEPIDADPLTERAGSHYARWWRALES